MAANAKPDYINVRIPQPMRDRLDAHHKAISTRMVPRQFADAVREVIAAGLDAIEQRRIVQK